jgi:hypothetical protein
MPRVSLYASSHVVLPHVTLLCGADFERDLEAKLIEGKREQMMLDSDDPVPDPPPVHHPVHHQVTAR